MFRNKDKEQRKFATRDFGNCLQKFSIYSQRETECFIRNRNDRFACKLQSADVAAVQEECRAYQGEIERLDRKLYPRSGN